MENNDRPVKDAEKDEFFEEPVPVGVGNEGRPERPVSAREDKTIRNVLLGVGAVLLAVAFFLIGWFGRYYAIPERSRTLLWAIDTVEKNYYTDAEDKLYDGLFDAFEVDPYSRFYTAEEYAEVLRENAGENSGIGISLATDGTSTMIFKTIGNSPAQNAGIRRGMYLYAIDGEPVVSAEAAVSAIRSKRTMTLRCGYSEETAKDYSVTSGTYFASYCFYRDSETSFALRPNGAGALVPEETFEPIPSLPDDTAYISIGSFDGNVVSEFISCLGKMKERNKTDLILDLRSNGGGYLDYMGMIAARLVKTSQRAYPVLKAKYRDGHMETFAVQGNEYSRYFGDDSRFTVLADENTASASEALIGALLDYGTISYGDIWLRERADGSASTYGKGIMQSHIRGDGGDVVKLTVATVHWPISEKCIHGVGINKDDGVRTCPAPPVWGEDDPMLDAAIASLLTGN